MYNIIYNINNFLIWKERQIGQGEGRGENEYGEGWDGRGVKRRRGSTLIEHWI